MKLHKGHLGRIIAVLALAIVPRLGPAQSSHAADLWPAGAYATYAHEVETLNGAIAAHLNRRLLLPIHIMLNPVDKKVSDAAGKLIAVYAWTSLGPRDKDCLIYFNPSILGLRGHGWSVVVAHEVYHCFEDAINPDTNPWIAEGQSEWVGEEVAGPSPTVAGPAWKRYLRRPEIPLFTRDYDAIGFYAHLAESCVNPWMILDAMLRAARHGDQSA